MSRSLPDYHGLPKSVVGWIYKHAARNFWRVADWYDLDDLIQDGLLMAYKCRERYGESGKDLDPPHFMALVKSTFQHHIGDLLRHSRGEQECTIRLGDMAAKAALSDERILDALTEPSCPTQELAALVAGMPASLAAAVAEHMRKFAADANQRPRDMEQIPEARLRRRRRHYTTATRDADLAAADPFLAESNFEVLLRAYLWECEHVADASA